MREVVLAVLFICINAHKREIYAFAFDMNNYRFLAIDYCDFVECGARISLQACVSKWWRGAAGFHPEVCSEFRGASLVRVAFPKPATSELNGDLKEDLCGSQTKCHGTNATKPIHQYCSVYLLALHLQRNYHDPGWTVRQQQLVWTPTRHDV